MSFCPGRNLVCFQWDRGAPGQGVRGCTLTPGHFSDLTPGHFSALPPGHFSDLTPGHFSDLTPGHFSDLTPGHFSDLTPGQRIREYDGRFGPAPSHIFRRTSGNVRRPTR